MMIEKFRIEQKRLEVLWRKGMAGIDPLRQYSNLVDSFLANCFQEAVAEEKDTFVAIVALGGYGRQELFPYSDIDLMILYRPGYKEVGAVTDGILYPLWDRGC